LSLFIYLVFKEYRDTEGLFFPNNWKKKR